MSKNILLKKIICFCSFAFVLMVLSSIELITFEPSNLFYESGSASKEFIFRKNVILIDDEETSFESYRGGEYTDPNDSTSWSNAVNITNNDYTGVFSSGSDYDYYYYSPSYSRRMYIYFSNMETGANPYIWLYDSNYSLITSYSNNTPKNDGFYANNTIFVLSGDVAYIKVKSNISTTYDICVNSTYNPSGVNTYLSDFDGIFTSSVSTIHYNLNSSMNSYVYNTSYTYRDIFSDAIQIWNSIGMSITLSTTYGDKNIDVYAISRNLITDDDTVGQTSYQTPTTGIFIKKHYFVPYRIDICNDMSEFSTFINVQAQNNGVQQNSSEAYYRYTLSTFIHEIGHTLGIKHCEKNYNNMYSAISLYFGMGDGDIWSALYNW